MNLAIEYLTRNNVAEEMIRLPCSLFLKSIKDDTPLVLTFHNCFGKPKKVNIKRWGMGDRSKVMPECKEFEIPRQELASSEHSVIEGYQPVQYIASPYHSEKQLADYPYSKHQEKTYNSCIDNFFNTDTHKVHREAWLWSHWLKIYFPQSARSREFGSAGCPAQMVNIKANHPNAWAAWIVWNKHFLLGNNNSVASELIFTNAYRKYMPKPKRKSRYSGFDWSIPNGYYSYVTFTTT